VSGNVALIVGARGVIGGNLARHLERLGGWRAIGLSRRGGESTEVIRHVSVAFSMPRTPGASWRSWAR
jgi:nucleoside-diphosphate-sugar epimerase